MKGGAGDVSSMMRMNVHLFYRMNVCIIIIILSLKTPGPVRYYIERDLLQFEVLLLYIFNIGQLL